MTKTSSRRGARRCASDGGRESASRKPRCAGRQRRKIESWRTGHRDSEPPHMDVWADQVARGIRGGGDMECVDVGTGRGNGLGAVFRM